MSARTWALSIVAATAGVWFAHECAHGLGYRLDDVRVSTGFNMVGSPDKAPGDPGFRSGVPVTGTPNRGTLFGPLLTWTVACAATASFLRWPKGKRGVVFAATAVSAAMQRVLPLVSFFGAAPFGRVVYQDEVEWGARHVKGMRFPMPFDAFQAALRDRPRQFLSTPAVYAWPAVSVGVCGGCLTLIYTRLRRNDPVPTWRTFAGVPITAWLAVAAVFGALDRVVRINW